MTALVSPHPPRYAGELPMRDRGRIAKALGRFGLRPSYTLAELRRAFLRDLHTLRPMFRCRHDHELQALNAYLVAKAALLGQPIPESRTRKAHYPPTRRPKPEAPPMLAAAFGVLHIWEWRRKT